MRLGQEDCLERKQQTIILDVNNKRHGIESKIAKTILSDFNKFKDDNELVYCSLHQSKPNANVINVTWKTEKRYQNKLVVLDRIQRDFNEFAEFNNEEFCQISNMDCKDDVYVVEYNVHRSYRLQFVFNKETDGE